MIDREVGIIIYYIRLILCTHISTYSQFTIVVIYYTLYNIKSRKKIKKLEKCSKFTIFHNFST